MISYLIAIVFAAALCSSEDEFNCVWHAQAMGNGQGHSFIALGNEDNFVLFALD